jgi:ankyrin repeat protein
MRKHERTFCYYILYKQYFAAKSYLKKYNEHINVNNSTNFNGVIVTPIFQLLLNDNEKTVDLIRMLLNHKLDLSIKDCDKNTLLLFACVKNNIGAAKLFIENRCDIEARNEHDKTPLIIAIENDNIELIKLLLDHGAKTNNMLKLCIRRYNYPDSDIMYNSRVIKLLLDAHANPNEIKDGRFQYVVCNIGCYDALEKMINHTNINNLYPWDVGHTKNRDYMYYYSNIEYYESCCLLQNCIMNILNLCEGKKNDKMIQNYINIAKFLIRNEILMDSIFNSDSKNRLYIPISENKYVKEIMKYKGEYNKEMYLQIYNFTFLPDVLCKLIHSYI